MSGTAGNLKLSGKSLERQKALDAKKARVQKKREIERARKRVLKSRRRDRVSGLTDPGSFLVGGGEASASDSRTEVVGGGGAERTVQRDIVDNRSRSSGNSPVDPGPGFDIENTIRRGFEDILQGKSSSFPEERFELEMQKLNEDSRATESRLNRELDRDLIRRGIFRSGIAARNQREVKLHVDSELSEAERQLKIEKLKAEFSDRMTALNLAQSWLDSRRRYEIGKEQIAAQREATRAQIALGYAQIAASKENARMSASAARAGLGLQREQFNESVRRYEESKIPIPKEMQPSFGGQSKIPPSTFNAVMGSGF